MKNNAMKLRVISWDHVGIVLSFLCLLHCLFLPFLMAMLPALSLEIFESEVIHKMLALGVSIVSLLAFVPGLRLHKKKFVILLAAFGLFCILSAVLYAGERWGELAEKALTSVGGFTLIAAHLLNRTFCRACSSCEERDEDSCKV